LKTMPEQAAEVMADYTEFFDAGLAEGKSETEVAHELGDPPRIVLSLLEKDRSLSKPVQAEKPPYAPIGDRLIAFIIDAVLSLFPLAFLGVANVLIFVPFWPLAVFNYAIAPSFGPPAPTSIAVAWLFLVYAFLYQPVFLVLWHGQTPGKRLTGIKVVKEDGTSVNTFATLLRELLGKTIVYSLTFGFGSLFSFLWALISREKKTIPDAIAGTRVVSVKGR